jgi:hypothetical protein
MVLRLANLTNARTEREQRALLWLSCLLRDADRTMEVVLEWRCNLDHPEDDYATRYAFSESTLHELTCGLPG